MCCKCHLDGHFGGSVASFRALASLSFEPRFSLCCFVNFRFRRTFNDVVFKVFSIFAFFTRTEIPFWSSCNSTLVTKPRKVNSIEIKNSYWLAKDITKF